MTTLVNDLTYRNYRFNRDEAPEVSPARWARVYGPQAAQLEAQYQAEQFSDGSQGDVRSFEAEEIYEHQVVAQARAIVAGRSERPVTVEHLRVVLGWLDGWGDSVKEGGLPAGGSPF